MCSVTTFFQDILRVQYVGFTVVVNCKPLPLTLLLPNMKEKLWWSQKIQKALFKASVWLLLHLM